MEEGGNNYDKLRPGCPRVCHRATVKRIKRFTRASFPFPSFSSRIATFACAPLLADSEIWPLLLLLLLSPCRIFPLQEGEVDQSLGSIESLDNARRSLFLATIVLAGIEGLDGEMGKRHSKGQIRFVERTEPPICPLIQLRDELGCIMDWAELLTVVGSRSIPPVEADSSFIADSYCRLIELSRSFERSPIRGLPLSSPWNHRASL